MHSLFGMDIQEQVKNLILSLPCHVHKPYPSPMISVKNKRIADLLLAAYANGGNAEFTAVAQYMNHSLTIREESVSSLEYCIALVEMYHLHLIGKMIDTLGGEPRYWSPNNFYWTGGFVAYGNTLCEKLAFDILAEQEAVAGYDALLKIIRSEKGPEVQQVESVIKRIVEDEKLHITLFTQAYEKYCGTPWKQANA